MFVVWTVKFGAWGGGGGGQGGFGRGIRCEREAGWGRRGSGVYSIWCMGRDVCGKGVEYVTLLRGKQYETAVDWFLQLMRDKRRCGVVGGMAWWGRAWLVRRGETRWMYRWVLGGHGVVVYKQCNFDKSSYSF